MEGALASSDEEQQRHSVCAPTHSAGDGGEDEEDAEARQLLAAQELLAQMEALAGAPSSDPVTRLAAGQVHGWLAATLPQQLEQQAVEVGQQVHALQEVSRVLRHGGEDEGVLGTALGQLEDEVEALGARLAEQYEAAERALHASLRPALAAARRGGAAQAGHGHAAGVPTDEQCAEALQGVGSSVVPDASVVDQWTQQLLTHRDALAVALHAAAQQWEGVCSEARVRPDDPAFGWSHADHATFSSVLQSSGGRHTAGSGHTASTRGDVSRRLQEQLPHKSAESIARHWRVVDAASARQRATKDAHAAFHRHQREVLRGAAAAFQACKAAHEEAAERAAAVHAAAAAAQAKRRRLRRLQAADAERQAQESAAAAAAASEAAAAAAAAEAKAQADAAARRAKVRAWAQEVAAAEAASAAATAAAAEAAAEAARAAVAEAAPRVAARAALRQAAAEAARERAAKAEAEAEVLRQRLQDIKDTAPYAEAVAGLTRDTDRLNSHTTASYAAAQLGTAHAAYVAATSAAFARQRREGGGPTPGQPVTGVGANTDMIAAARQGVMGKELAAWRMSEKGHFASEREGLSDARVFSDVRAKLLFALSAAGLAGSEAAGAALAAAARPVPRALAPTHNFL